jgi:phospholipid transport system substrate-binding protein
MRMEMPVRQWFMIAILLLPALGQGVEAKEKGPKGAKEQPAVQSVSQTKDANDPNESWWRKWDVAAKDPNNPHELLTAKWNAVLKVLQAQNMDQTAKQKIVDRIVSPLFDFPLMGQLALGRTHWPKLNAAQREKFIRFFVDRLKAVYLEKTSLYTDETFTLRPATAKNDLIHIHMTLLSDNKEIDILYNLHKLDASKKDKALGRWRIYDVEIEGVSILADYRSQFDNFLRRRTVEELLSQMEKPPAQ